MPQLPDFIFKSYVFKYLDLGTLSQTARTNKKWQKFSEAEIKRRVREEAIEKKASAPFTEKILESIHETTLHLFYAYEFKALASKYSDIKITWISLSGLLHEICSALAGFDSETKNTFMEEYGRIQSLVNQKISNSNRGSSKSEQQSSNDGNFVCKSTTGSYRFLKRIMKTRINADLSTSDYFSIFLTVLILNAYKSTPEHCHIKINTDTINELITELELHLKHLLETGIDINILWKNKSLYETLMLGFSDVKRSYLKYEDIDFDSEADSSALSILELLFHYGLNADLELLNESRAPLLYLVSVRCFKSATHLAQKAVASINSQDNSSLTALHLSVMEKCYDLTEALLQNNADPSIQDLEGNTCLHLFFKNNQSCSEITKHDRKLLNLLLESYTNSKKDINLINLAGDTLLHGAVRFGDLLVVNLLLENGADPVAVNLDGQTPIDMANQAGKLEIAQLLRNKLDNINQETEAQMQTLRPA